MRGAVRFAVVAPFGLLVHPGVTLAHAAVERLLAVGSGAVDRFVALTLAIAARCTPRPDSTSGRRWAWNCSASPGLEWVVAVDSTVARAHQHAAGAPTNSTGGGVEHMNPWPEPEDHALGRSRGGWSTKTHLSVDARGRPLSVRLTAGQAHDNPS